jgi:hypothetical protein
VACRDGQLRRIFCVAVAAQLRNHVALAVHYFAVSEGIYGAMAGMAVMTPPRGMSRRPAAPHIVFLQSLRSRKHILTWQVDLIAMTVDRKWVACTWYVFHDLVLYPGGLRPPRCSKGFCVARQPSLK